MAESKGSKSEGFTLTFTASGAITEGDIVEQTTTAGTVNTCATKESIKVIGQAITTAATGGLVSVQFNNMVKLNGRVNSGTQYTTAIVAGENLWVGSDAADTSGIQGQVLVHAATDAGTTGDHNTDLRKIVAMAFGPVSTTDTNTAINVLLKI